MEVIGTLQFVSDDFSEHLVAYANRLIKVLDAHECWH